MVKKELFFKGYKSILKPDSPAIALGCCFIAIGALLKNIGFNIQESIFSTMLIYVWFVNARLYPMAVSLFPLMIHDEQPKWKYYLSCHFIAVSAWLIMKSNYETIEKKDRVDYWIGIGSATWSVAVLATIFGFYLSDYLNKDMLMGLAILNPIYFTCMLVGAMKTAQVTLSVILGAFLGPVFYFISPEWSILLGGLSAGSLAYFFGEKSVY